MVIYLWIAKNNDQICNSGLFLQNALVEYIGVYSYTNNLKEGYANFTFKTNLEANNVLVLQGLTLFLCNSKFNSTFW